MCQQQFLTTTFISKLTSESKKKKKSSNNTKSKNNTATMKIIPGALYGPVNWNTYEYRETFLMHKNIFCAF